MSRPITNDCRIDNGIEAAIRDHCFGNLSAFYKRFSTLLPMSRATFFRVINSENTSMENVMSVEMLARKIGLADRGGGSSYVVKKQCTREFIECVEDFLADSSDNNREKMRRTIIEYKPLLLT